MSFTLAAGLSAACCGTQIIRVMRWVTLSIMHFESMALALGESPMQTSIPKSIHYILMGEYVPGQLMRCGDSLTG